MGVSVNVDLLLDTNVVIWLAAGEERVRRLMPILEDDSSTVTISVVSWFEVAIRHSAGKLDASVHLLQKPYHPDALSARIRHLLRRRVRRAAAQGAARASGETHFGLT